MDRVEAVSFIDYLQAKKTVDDRALNRHVLSALRESLVTDFSMSPVRILEVGAGTGTMLTRLIDWGVISRATYTAVDINAALIEEGRRRLGRYAKANALITACGPESEIILSSDELDLSVEFKSADVLEFMHKDTNSSAYDLLIAHAFLDLIDLPSTLPNLLQTLRPGGYVYFTLNFDGITHFEPAYDLALDAQIESLYHATMAARTIDGKPSGDHHTGRHLLSELANSGAKIIAAGASDWIVYPVEDGYPAEEDRFLRHILDTIETALAGSRELDPEEFSNWLSTRRAQVDSGDLIYMAHQIDVLGQWPGGNN